MALTKTTIVPLFDTDFPYMRISKVVRIDEIARDAEFNVHAFPSEASARKPGVQGTQVAVIRFMTDAFDLYFSKAILKATDNDVYAQAYLAAKNWTEANVLRRANEKASTLTPPGPQVTLTPDQIKLVTNAFVSGPLGESIFVGAADA